MTTFTLQDLTINNLPTTPEEDEAMQALSEKQHAPVPQPTLCEPTQTPDLSTIINTICTQLQLLTTIISQPKAQPEGAQVEENSSSNASLQETVGLVFEQSDWFKDMVKEEIESRVESEVIPWLERRVEMIYAVATPMTTTLANQTKENQHDHNFNDAGENSLQETIELTLQQAVWFEKMVEEQVEERVESEVESYFQHGFDPSNYFDFDDAVSNEVRDQIDDIVRDQLDDVVADKLEEVVAERLKSIRVVFD